MNSAPALRTGGCLCGSVRYEVRGALRPVVMCHCTQCRRMSGHFLAATAARHADFRLVSQGELHWYVSSAEGRRGFCARCGSTLFWQGTGRDYVSIAAGSLDDSSGLETAWHIFVGDKGAYYEIDKRARQSLDGSFDLPW